MYCIEFCVDMIFIKEIEEILLLFMKWIILINDFIVFFICWFRFNCNIFVNCDGKMEKI